MNRLPWRCPVCGRSNDHWSTVCTWCGHRTSSLRPLTCTASHSPHVCLNGTERGVCHSGSTERTSDVRRRQVHRLLPAHHRLACRVRSLVRRGGVVAGTTAAQRRRPGDGCSAVEMIAPSSDGVSIKRRAVCVSPDREVGCPSNCGYASSARGHHDAPSEEGGIVLPAARAVDAWMTDRRRASQRASFPERPNRRRRSSQWVRRCGDRLGAAAGSPLVPRDDRGHMTTTTQ